jgi:hypothetical protein
VASEFLQRRQEVIPDWYPTFLNRARAHMATNSLPLLQLAAKPPLISEELIRKDLLQELGYEHTAYSDIAV